MNLAIALLALATFALSTPLEDLTACLRTASVPIASSPPTPYNLRLPVKPLLLVVPTTTPQIASAVACGARNGVGVSAKSGGHSYTSAGFGGEDGHLVINLDRMYGVTVASDGTTARVQAGARLGHVATELYRQGKRAISHGTCPAVGVGGHALHGGHGMVSRTYGLATDWIQAATVVLANGTITRCSATERPNLFWSIRGAGSSMAIVAELEFNTFAAPDKVTYFDIDLVWDVAKLPQVLVDTQEFARTMPAELTMSTTFNNDGVYLNGAYVGDDKAFRTAVQPLLAKIGVQVSSSKTVGWIDFIKHYAGVTDIDITTATYNEHDNSYASSLTTPALAKTTFQFLVDTIAKHGLTATRSWYMHMNFHGGPTSAVARPKTDDTAYVHRDKMLLFQLKDGVSTSQTYPADGFALLQGLRQSITRALGSDQWGMYANYPDSQVSGSEAPRIYWGSNLQRLEWIKADYDPTNVFRDAQSIQPAK
ncbi:hypothetical protein CORC01_02910 [Colletotrichum orchidophilum]|uniref:FAD-binding PCMH-type domain-containing protein n=1 Tax=Colletotrichum orchidophilum TaxID=1209926 RepID=A0A1G4BJV1_9PEZI|nr:uncharacterized protein CORC01_02910 [Colletotrichum orchidophilum]OHF01719.1 hypothetical protein CORC01_02910 [Colletotrichum orchidophilum]